MSRCVFASVALCLLLILATACSQRRPYVYGSAIEHAFAQQRLNPDAPENPAPCENTPADLLSQIYAERYVKNMVEEKDTADQGHSTTSRTP